ncbi:MAG: hypothetical protein Q9159_006675, partial [Coniocarpon cinnabarinum]
LVERTVALLLNRNSPAPAKSYSSEVIIFRSYFTGNQENMSSPSSSKSKPDDVARSVSQAEEKKIIRPLPEKSPAQAPRFLQLSVEGSETDFLSYAKLLEPFGKIQHLVRERVRFQQMGLAAFHHNYIKLEHRHSECDYINASIVRRSKADRLYDIATQFPLPKTTCDFWQMVWEKVEDNGKIINLEANEEADKKVHGNTYFPLARRTLTLPFGDDSKSTFRAELIREESKEDPDIGSTKHKLCLKHDQKEKVIWLYQFERWPDQDLPSREDRPRLVALCRETSDTTGPRVVHCLMGSGRSGTFLALDQLLRQLDEGVMDRGCGRDEQKNKNIMARMLEPTPFNNPHWIKDIVSEMRAERPGMVNVCAQYCMLFDLIGHEWAVRHDKEP